MDTFADRYYRALYEVLLRVHLNKPSKLDEYFSLLFKSIKADPNPARVLAFVRRVIQMSTINEASFTAACLLIISELIRCKDDLRFQMYSLDQISNRKGAVGPSGKKSQAKHADSDSEEERFIDVDKLEEEVEAANKKQQVAVEAALAKPVTSKNQYDPLKREPKFANAESTPLYEIICLTFHAHPTVRLWATNLLEGQLISYSGDPLLDFGMANFLDRIAYKNPKSLDKLSTAAAAGRQFSSNRRMAAIEQPVNLYDFTGNGAENDMPTNPREEEQYLYKYFK